MQNPIDWGTTTNEDDWCAAEVEPEPEPIREPEPGRKFFVIFNKNVVNVKPHYGTYQFACLDKDMIEGETPISPQENFTPINHYNNNPPMVWNENRNFSHHAREFVPRNNKKFYKKNDQRKYRSQYHYPGVPFIYNNNNIPFYDYQYYPQPIMVPFPTQFYDNGCNINHQYVRFDPTPRFPPQVGNIYPPYYGPFYAAPISSFQGPVLFANAPQRPSGRYHYNYANNYVPPQQRPKKYQPSPTTTSTPPPPPPPPAPAPEPVPAPAQAQASAPTTTVAPAEYLSAPNPSVQQFMKEANAGNVEQQNNGEPARDGSQRQ